MSQHLTCNHEAFWQILLYENDTQNTRRLMWLISVEFSDAQRDPRKHRYTTQKVQIQAFLTVYFSSQTDHYPFHCLLTLFPKWIFKFCAELWNRHQPITLFHKEQILNFPTPFRTSQYLSFLAVVDRIKGIS